jgi:hypothetical protein
MKYKLLLGLYSNRNENTTKNKEKPREFTEFLRRSTSSQLRQIYPNLHVSTCFYKISCNSSPGPKYLQNSYYFPRVEAYEIDPEIGVQRCGTAHFSQSHE